ARGGTRRAAASPQISRSRRGDEAWGHDRQAPASTARGRLGAVCQSLRRGRSPRRLRLQRAVRFRRSDPHRLARGSVRGQARGMRTELEKIVGPAAVDERPVRDMWPVAIMAEREGKAPPKVLVARPAGRDQVAAVLRWAGANNVAVSPMGGGSGVCGALSPAAGEIVLDMSAFDRVAEIDETNLVCSCEAGVNGYALEEQLNARGLTLGHYPSSLPGTTVGGLIATRSSGQESSRYGSIEDMVLGLAVVLPDGTFAAPRPGPRSAAGPALHQVFLGAEGGLGVVIGAVLRVHRLPEATFGRGYAFGDLRAGLECMRSVMQAGIRQLVMRLYDAEDTLFTGYELQVGECLLVIAAAGLGEGREGESR